MLEGVTHLLDTSVYSQPIKNVASEAVLRRWSAMDERRLCISAICHYEVEQGLRQRNSATYWARYREILEGRFRILPFDAAVAVELADLQTTLKKSGRTKPLADMIIAATARCHGLIVVTLNVRDFDGVPGVSVENWSR